MLTSIRCPSYKKAQHHLAISIILKCKISHYFSVGDKKPKAATPETEAEPDYDDGFEEDEDNQDRSSSRGSSASEADRNDRSSRRGSNASDADKNDRSSSRGSHASVADGDDRSSSRDSNSPKKSKYEEDYDDNDYEDDGSRPASQKSESRPVTRASSKGNSAASSRPESVTSNKADSRPASAQGRVKV